LKIAKTSLSSSSFSTDSVLTYLAPIILYSYLTMTRSERNIESIVGTQPLVGFQTVLRLRPHHKKERDDPVLLEAVPNCPNTVVLHSTQHNQLLSPSLALVRQTLSPEAVKSAQDADFRFDSILWPDTSQDKVYFSHVLPMALSAMEPLKDPQQPVKNHLLIAMGAAGSGKTYTCWGGTPVSARKHDSDGLLPRILDGLFSQSKHHIFAGGNSSKKKKYTFAVSVTLLQVNQDQMKAHDCQIHDLLQSPATNHFSIASATSAISSLGCASLVMSPVMQSMKESDRTCSGGSSSASSAGHKSPHFFAHSNKTSSGSHEDIFLEQDSVTSDFKVVNAQVEFCYDEVHARETLQMAWKNRSRLSHSKKYQTHVYASLQPILLDRSSKSEKIVRKGGIMAVLDMGSYESPAIGHSKQLRANRGKETVLSHANDAHAAVMHCLSTLRLNQEMLTKDGTNSNQRTPEDPCGSRSRSGEADYVRDGLGMKKVSYRQSDVTMMIQPIFGSCSDAAVVTLIVTAYTGHREYPEKKALMSDVSAFCGGFPCQLVSTGLTKVAIKSTATPRKEKAKRLRKRIPVAVPSDADDEGSVERPKAKVPAKVEIIRTKPIAVAPGVLNVSSMGYSDSEEEDDQTYVTLPPPVAPSYMRDLQPSAPLENSYAVADASLMPQLYGSSDFPGVNLTAALSAKHNKSDSPPYHSAGAVPGDAHTIRPPLQSKPVHVEQPSLHESHKFSPMKTFNGIMHASKKKGLQAIEKISYPVPPATKAAPNLDALQPSHHVVLENQKLAAINESLQEKNDRLQRENEALRTALVGHNRERSPCPALEDEPTTTSCKENSDSSFSAKDNLVDSDLFQFMAQLRSNNQY
jgi:hypothetical protein